MTTNLKKWTWREARRQVTRGIWIEIAVVNRCKKNYLFGSDAMLQVAMFKDIKELQKCLYKEINEARIRDILKLKADTPYKFMDLIK